MSEYEPSGASPHPFGQALRGFAEKSPLTRALPSASKHQSVPRGCCVKTPLLVSACLAGEACRYDGVSKPHPGVQALVERGVALPVCPEYLGGLGVPRIPCEIREGLVLNAEGADCTLAFRAGAQLALNVAQTRGCGQAILKARSPSCGCGQVYDGTFSRTLHEGDGVFAALLKKKGVRVWTEENAPFAEFEVEAFSSCAGEAAGAAGGKPRKRGVLLVAYGAGNPQSAAALRRVRAEAERRFVLPARWAYTSETLRERIALARMKSDSVLKALRRMAFERYEEIAVQSLHLIPGVEYDGVLGDVELARRELPCDIRVGLPLLFSPDDAASAAAALLAHVRSFRSGREPVICMGHGSGRHGAAALYQALSDNVRNLDDSVRVACMNGAPSLEDVLNALDFASDEKELWLMPLLSASGRHARHDMAGGHAQSWRSRLEEAGFLCRADVRGLADAGSFVELWMERLRAVLRSFDRPPSDPAATLQGVCS